MREAILKLIEEEKENNRKISEELSKQKTMTIIAHHSETEVHKITKEALLSFRRENPARVTFASSCGRGINKKFLYDADFYYVISGNLVVLETREVDEAIAKYNEI